MAWFQRTDDIGDAISKGDLEFAMDQLRERPGKRIDHPRLARRLTSALVHRANAAVSTGNLIAAWQDLTSASEFAAPTDQDHLSRQTNQLVELTIEHAESLLLKGKTSHAVQLIQQLTTRKVLDWRADRIREVAGCLTSADELAALGRFDEAILRLQTARNLLPELDQLPGRMESQRHRAEQVEQLTKQLQRAALKCHWNEVSQLCQQILKIAPKHEIASAAQKHAVQRMKRKTSAGSRKTNVPERVTESNSFFRIDPSTVGGSPATPVVAAPPELGVVAWDELPSFLIWVDGVGGYLICRDPVNTIGQAIDGTTISIPLQADLRERHARIEFVSGQHLVQPLGQVSLDGEPQRGGFVLGNGQTMALGPGVRLQYHQPHPLSKTARLDFISRHRTQPWSDGVLLVSRSVILGPNPNNHVHCPLWTSDVIFFERNGSWFCRAQQPFSIDGKDPLHEGEIHSRSHIVGDDFSLTLEPVHRLRSESSET